MASLFWPLNADKPPSSKQALTDMLTKGQRARLARNRVSVLEGVRAADGEILVTDKAILDYLERTSPDDGRKPAEKSPARSRTQGSAALGASAAAYPSVARSQGQPKRQLVKELTGGNSNLPGRATIFVYERGKRVDESRACESCKKEARPVWRFWNTDRGALYLCKGCMELARERSKKSDALDHRIPGDFYRR
jgi:hypothetical protein